MNDRCRAILAGTALLGTAFALAGCEGVAQSMVESDAKARAARYAAQGNPQFAEPRLAAVVKQFEADYAAIGLDAAKLGLEQGTPCPAAPEAAFRTVFGMTPAEYEKSQLELAQKVSGYTGLADPDAVRIVTLSGFCGANGPDGPAVIVATQRTITRYRGEGYSNVTVTDSVVRTDATWENGVAREQRSVILISQAAPFKETAEGQLAEDINDWNYLNTIRTAPTASYVYSVYDPDGSVKYQVSFLRSDGSGLYSTMVIEQLDAHHSHMRSWQGTELISESGFKDGKQHGWYVTYPQVYNGTQVPGRRDCYQNGEMVKALECPSS